MSESLNTQVEMQYIVLLISQLIKY